MSWKVYAQNPEDKDDQGIYLKAEGEEAPWQTEIDCEEFDAVHNPSEAGYSVRDLQSAKRWYSEVFGNSDEVIEFEVYS